MGEMGDKLRDFKRFLEEMEEQQKEERERNKITAHYGMKDSEFSELVGKAIALMLDTNNKTKVLDALFPELDGTGRLKVEAYKVAYEIMARGNARS